MDEDAIIKRTEDYVKDQLFGDSTGHDWWHIRRVTELSLSIAEQERSVDVFVIRLASLLHDIDDWKFTGGDELAAARQARTWLEKLQAEENVVEHVCEIVANVSFKGAGVKNLMRSREGKIVQDADRLDALGAIGIARAFSYGGSSGQALHDPSVKPQYHASFEEYKNSRGSTIGHFHEKLLLLKNQMNTEAGRKIAEARTEYMETFLEQFHAEWRLRDSGFVTNGR